MIGEGGGRRRNQMTRKHCGIMGKSVGEKHIWDTKAEVLSRVFKFRVCIQHQSGVWGLRDRAHPLSREMGLASHG